MSPPFRYSAEQSVVLAFDRDMVVSAGAGSGKTRTLVGIYCRLLSDPAIARPAGAAIAPHEILCLTFTNRAAGEIRRRIRETLHAPDLDARLGVPGRRTDPALVESWTRDLEGAPIFTFHAFCHWLVMRHPLEVGIDPASTLLSEDEADDLLQRSVLEHMRKELQRGDVAVERAVELEGLGGAVDAVSQLIARVRTAGWSSRRVIETFEARVEATRSEVTALADRVRELTEWMLGEMGRENPTDARRRRIADTRAALDAWWTRDEPVEAIIEGCKGASKAWTDPLKEAVEAWRGAAAEVEHIDQTGCWPALVVSAREAYRAARRAGASLDFDDLILRARELLERDDLRRLYQRRFRAILVDEHQDTDPVQHEILELLTGAESLTGRPREDAARWFVVGDGQQSIYRFRGADLVKFQGLVEAAAAWNGHLTLKRNHRSRKELLDFFNDFFPEVLRGGEAGFEIEYMPQETDRPPVGRTCVEYLDPDGMPRMGAYDARRVEAEALAARLRAACDPDHPARVELTTEGGGTRVARPGDIVVLLRKLTACELYRQALQRVGFDVVVAGGGLFYQRQEVFDCLHALDAALHPENAVALVAYLRSPMVGLPDDAIWQALRGAPGRTGLRLRAWIAGEEGLAALEPEHRGRLEDGLAVLDELAARADTEPAGATLAWLVDRTGYASVLDALPDRSQRRANVERLIATADRSSGRSGSLLGDFVAALRRRVDAPPRQHDAAPPASEGQIRIMTIHQAKGLEFPVVAVADIGGNPGQGEPRVAFHEEFGVVSQVWDDGVEDWIPSRSFLLAGQASDREETAEEMRLLYVAATRGEEHLILSALARTGSRERRWLAVFEPWSERGAVRVGLARLPLAEWAETFRAAQTAPPPTAPDAEPYRDRLEAAPGQIDARSLAGRMAGAEPWEASPGARFDPAASRRAVRRGAAGHQLLQRLPLDCGEDFDLAAWLDDAAVEGDHRDELARFVAIVLPELQRARRVEREYPFRLHLPGGGIVVGTIDVLLEDESGGWWVWDYKFGERDPRTEARHEAQLSIYAVAVAAALDLDFVGGRVWHVGELASNDFAWNADALREVEARMVE